MDFMVIKQKELSAVSSQLESGLVLKKILLSTDFSVCDLLSLPMLPNKFLKKFTYESYSKKF